MRAQFPSPTLYYESASTFNSFVAGSAKRMEWKTDAAAAKVAHDEARAAMVAATEAKKGAKSAALRERLAARRAAAEEKQ